MKIIIETVEHKDQRYDTCGDWQFENYGRDLHIKVSKLGNEDYEFLVGIHEAIEAWLCRHFGVKEEDVTAFDTNYEANRDENSLEEPGDCYAAPYHYEHRLATEVEKFLAAELDVNWFKYNEDVENLVWREDEQSSEEVPTGTKEKRT